MKWILMFLTISGPVFAQDWRSLSGSEIETALDDRKLTYTAAWQIFYASGRTLYNAGRDSWGAWRVQGDQYCSEWPPNAGWECYDMAISADGQKLRFISTKGNITDGWYAPN